MVVVVSVFVDWQGRQRSAGLSSCHGDIDGGGGDPVSDESSGHQSRQSQAANCKGSR